MNSFFYLFSLVITNLFVYLISQGSVETATKQPIQLEGYSEIVLSLELKTPFATGKKINLYSQDTKKTYADIFLFSQEEKTESFEAMDSNKFVLYVPDHMISELAQSTKLIAVPYRTSIKTAYKVKTSKENYEIIY